MPTASEKAQIQAIRKEIRRIVENTVVNTTLEASRQLYDKTPKETTWTASNWSPSMGGQGDGTVRGLREARENRVKQSGAILTGYKLGVGKTYVSNGLRHIERLAAAGSPKLGVAAGWVQQAIAGTVKVVEARLRRGNFERRGGSGR